MRIPVWSGVRLSVWEPQNAEAVQVTMPFAEPYLPVRRVLSMRGWMVLLVRYDWRKRGPVDAGQSSRVRAFEEAADTLREIDPVGFRQAAEVCEALALRDRRERTGVEE